MTNNSQNNKQRALPPVPIQQVGQLDEPETDTSSHNQNENIIEPDVELNRRITPEIRPEDFPPGVAYLPDGDDDDFDEEDFNSKSNNKIDFASTIKTVKNVRNNTHRFHEKLLNFDIPFPVAGGDSAQF